MPKRKFQDTQDEDSNNKQSKVICDICCAELKSSNVKRHVDGKKCQKMAKLKEDDIEKYESTKRKIIKNTVKCLLCDKKIRISTIKNHKKTHEHNNNFMSEVRKIIGQSGINLKVYRSELLKYISIDNNVRIATDDMNLNILNDLAKIIFQYIGIRNVNVRSSKLHEESNIDVESIDVDISIPWFEESLLTPKGEASKTSQYLEYTKSSALEKTDRMSCGASESRHSTPLSTNRYIPIQWFEKNIDVIDWPVFIKNRDLPCKFINDNVRKLDSKCFEELARKNSVPLEFFEYHYKLLNTPTIDIIRLRKIDEKFKILTIMCSIVQPGDELKQNRVEAVPYSNFGTPQNYYSDLEKFCNGKLNYDQLLVAKEMINTSNFAKHYWYILCENDKIEQNCFEKFLEENLQYIMWDKLLNNQAISFKFIKKYRQIIIDSLTEDDNISAYYTSSVITNHFVISSIEKMMTTMPCFKVEEEEIKKSRELSVFFDKIYTLENNFKNSLKIY